MSPELIQNLILAVSLISLIITGLSKRPGIGILVTLAGVILLAFLQPSVLADFGFRNQESWMGTLGLSIASGAALALVALVLIEPLAEIITGQPHDISIVDDVRGSLGGLLRWLVIVWLTVGLLEELLFRGYLISEFSRLIGSGTPGLILALLLSSVAFGISHLYQGPSGVISSSTVGLLIGVIFLVTGFNLWLAILIHIFVDTFQLILIYFNRDQQIKSWIYKLPDE